MILIKGDHMKKIILFTVIIIFIPFVIVSFFKIDKKEEINLVKYFFFIFDWE